MANPWAGEAALVIDGERRVLKLTLGALAELEATLETGDLIELIERFESGAVLHPRRAGADRRGAARRRLARDCGRICCSADFDGGPVEAARVAGLLAGARLRAAGGRSVTSRFDWPGLMRAGMTGLRLTPEAFWRLTPAELLVMLGRDGQSAPMGRAGLHDLARRFPDMSRKRDDGRD